MNLHSLSINPNYMAPSAWWQHVPIAHWLISELRPARVVELGCHYGVSFFAFCEAAELLSPNTFVYAVDTWAGDEHAGLYGDEVFNKVYSHWGKVHRQRSRLIRSTFDEALEHFEDGSIDILHIDGLHSYDAVKHDFLSWKPKMKHDSIILFHDTNVRERDFGVWKLWEEIRQEYQTYQVDNGHGLGILVLGETFRGQLQSLPLMLPLLVSKGILVEKVAELMNEVSFQADKNQEELKRMTVDVNQAMQVASQAKEEANQAKDEASQVRAEINRATSEIRNLKDNLNQAIQMAETAESHVRSMVESRSWKLIRTLNSAKNVLLKPFT